MNYKTKFVFLGILILCGITLTVLTFTLGKESEEKTNAGLLKQHERNEQNEDLPPNVSVQKPVSNQDQVKKDTKNIPLQEIYQKPDDSLKDVATLSNAKVIENSARNHFRKFDFDEGLKLVSEGASKYSNEGEGGIVHKLNYDATLIENLNHSHGEDEHDHSSEGSVSDLAGKRSLLSYIKDPEMALLAILSLDLETRNELIASEESINPVFDGSVHILTQTTEPQEVVDNMSNRYANVAVVHRLVFNVENQTLYALVMEFEDGSSRLHSIQEVTEGTTSAMTVKEWNEIIHLEHSAHTEDTPNTTSTKGSVNPDELTLPSNSTNQTSENV